MKRGFTTGSCAAAAAKASAEMFFGREIIEKVRIITPEGTPFEPLVIEPEIHGDFSSCGIRKFSGDDPDITNGLLICARISSAVSDERIVIKGGKGVGVITRPGLQMPVGEWAINSVPRQMIKKEVLEIMEHFDYKGSLLVEIYVPEGEEISRKTFNPHLGIENGISILGSNGIVEPMSTAAVIKTIEFDLRQKKEEGNTSAVLVPGNYALNFLKNTYGYDEKRPVLMSNFVGEAIDKARDIGFKKILVVGHTGKMIKLSGGIMNTHSGEADGRMELFAGAVITSSKKYGFKLKSDLLYEIMASVSTSECIEILKKYNILKPVCREILEKILFHLRKRAGSDIDIECILYESREGLLASSDRAEEFLI